MARLSQSSTSTHCPPGDPLFPDSARINRGRLGRPKPMDGGDRASRRFWL